MSQPESVDDIVQTLGELGKSGVPVEEQTRAAYRRERVVRLLGTAITAESQRTQRGKVRPWLLAAAATALAVGGALSWPALHSRAASVAVAERPMAGEARSLTGTVSVRRGGEASAVHVGDRFFGGELLSTALNSRVEVGIASGRAELGAAGELEVMRPTASERRLRLGAGSVDVDLPHKLGAGKHLVVETPDAEVVVVGTAFTVELGREQGRTSTHVRVRRGTVWIMQGGKQRAVLAAGDDWRSATEVARPVATEVARPLAMEVAPRLPARAQSLETAPRVASGSRATDSGTLAEENRLFRLGLTARNAGDSVGAADAFGGLLARYPRSVLREQALAEQFRALERAGRSSAAAVAARRYLASYATGFARADAERVTSGLLGER